MNHREALDALGRSTAWRKSRYSQGDSDCVQINDHLDGWIGVRDSKLGTDSPTLVFTTTEWAAFTTAVREREF